MSNDESTINKVRIGLDPEHAVEAEVLSVVGTDHGCVAIYKGHGGLRFSVMVEGDPYDDDDATYAVLDARSSMAGQSLALPVIDDWIAQEVLFGDFIYKQNRRAEGRDPVYPTRDQRMEIARRVRSMIVGDRIDDIIDSFLDISDRAAEEVDGYFSEI